MTRGQEGNDWVVLKTRGLLAYLLALGLGTILGVTVSWALTTHPPASLELQMASEEVEAPDFSLRDLGGKQVRLKDFRGKVVFLNFFATWCDPCRLEMPAMERLHRANKDKGLVVLAVDIRESARTVRGFIQELKLSFPTVLDEDGSVAYMYAVRPVPATYLIGRDGKILWRAFGAREWDSREAHQYFSSLLDGRKR
jgi:peroxiredoxin